MFRYIYIQARVLEQALALEELEQASADAEERRKTSHKELFGMMAVLLKVSRDRGEQRGVRWVAVATHRRCSRESKRIVTEAEPCRGQLGRRGQDGRLDPIGEESFFTQGCPGSR